MSGYKMLFLAAVLAVTGVFSTGCSNNLLILENDPDMLTAFQGVFSETGYYNYDDVTGIYKLYDDNKSFIGYAFYADGKSYDGEFDGEGSKKGAPMKILVGLKDMDTIKGIVIVSHAEDYLFWRLLINADYLNQFDNLRIEDAYFTSDGGKIDCVTGATLSSVSVLDLARESAVEKIKLIE